MIAACCQNNGIGIKGNLPWKLKSEMAYFTRVTSETKDQNKQNAVIMGRKSWDSIPNKFKPLPGRINVVISQTMSPTSAPAGRPILGRGKDNDQYGNSETPNDNGHGVLPNIKQSLPDFVFNNLANAITFLNQQDNVENIFIIGGQQLYQLGLNEPSVTRIYLTRIQALFECDSFFPEIDVNQWSDVSLPSVPSEEQVEKDIKYKFHVYERAN